MLLWCETQGGSALLGLCPSLIERGGGERDGETGKGEHTVQKDSNGKNSKEKRERVRGREREGGGVREKGWKNRRV